MGFGVAGDQNLSNVRQGGSAERLAAAVMRCLPPLFTRSGAQHQQIPIPRVFAIQGYPVAGQDRRIIAAVEPVGHRQRMFPDNVSVMVKIKKPAQRIMRVSGLIIGDGRGVDRTAHFANFFDLFSSHSHLPGGRSSLSVDANHLKFCLNPGK